jgi:uncharacterized protein (DUF1697 family)
MDNNTRMFLIYILREWKKEVKKKPFSWADEMDEEDSLPPLPNY